MGDASLAKMITFVAGAYIGIWVISFAYLVYLGRNLVRLNNEVKILTQTLDKKKQ